MFVFGCPVKFKIDKNRYKLSFQGGRGRVGVGSVGLLQLMSEFGYDIRSGI